MKIVKLCVIYLGFYLIGNPPPILIFNHFLYVFKNIAMKLSIQFDICLGNCMRAWDEEVDPTLSWGWGGGRVDPSLTMCGICLLR